MKNVRPILMFSLFSALILSSCFKDTCESERTYVRWDPVFKTLEDMRTDISVQPAKELENPGNIYYYNGYLLINELLEGVHIVDNRDPENPVSLSFIDIPGSRDMAVKDDVLYVDSYLDLLSIRISDPRNPVLLHREEDVFQSFYPVNDEFGYVVEYVETDVQEVVNCSDDRWSGGWFWRDDAIFLSADANFQLNSSTAENADFGTSGGVGIAGSMARFAIAKDHLYALDQWQMQVFSIETTIPQQINKVGVNAAIETLFPSGDYLFIGSQTGMIIYDNTDPTAPYHYSTFEHAAACDPVFVSGNTAFVTLREGNACVNAVNQLDVIDVSNMRFPSLIESYPMHNPHGLSVVNDILYLCDGSAGLKVFNVEKLRRIDENMLDHLAAYEAFDVIVLPPGDLVMMIGADGFYQFDASDPEDLKEISFIRVNRK